jgi:hypothetical protein
MSLPHADAPEPIGRRIVAPLLSLSIGTVMSANDDISLYEIPDQTEIEPSEHGTIALDVTPVRRGYQSLFRAVCLGRRMAPPDPE